MSKTGYIIDHGVNDEKINTRVMHVNIDGIRFATPTKTFDTIERAKKINEFAPTFTEEILSQYLDNNFELPLPNSPQATISRLPEINKAEMINMMVPACTVKEISSEHIEAIVELQRNYADAIVVPSWRNLLKLDGNKRIYAIKETTARYLDQIGKINDLVIGNLPMSASLDELKDLMDFYYIQGITSFALDYCNRAGHTTAPATKFIKDKLRTDNYLNSSLLYSFNVRRMSSDEYRNYPANDFLVFGQGVDIIGNLHLGGGSNKDKDGNKICRPRPMRSPVFSPDHYTYHYEPSGSDEEKNLFKVRNYLMQEKEATRIRDTITYAGTSYEILYMKPGAQPITKMMPDQISKPRHKISLKDFYN